MRPRSLQTLRRPPIARFAAAAMALLFVAGQLGSLAHFVLVGHARCAEHGELIEVRSDAAQAGALQAIDAPASLGSAALAAEGHGHEHCALAPHQRQNGVAVGLCDCAVAAPPVGPGVQAASTGPLFVHLAVYRLAPKTSPPA